MISESLLIQEIFHGVFALPFAYILWKKTTSWKKGFLVIVLSYLIDLDHLLDYFSYYGLTFSLTRFLSADYFVATKRAFVLLHAWEWAGLLSIFSWKRGWKSIFTLILFAMLPHLIYDTITVRSFEFYSIIYRVGKGFTNLN